MASAATGRGLRTQRTDQPVTEPQPPEQAVLQFVHLCLQARWDASGLAAARALAAETSLNWDVFCTIVGTEGLAPLLYHILRDEGVVPDHVAHCLRQAYDANALHTTFLFHELEAVLRRFAADSIDVTLLKGAALSKTVYGRVPVRPLRDLDLLVREADTSRAIDVLRNLEYTPVTAEPHAGAHLVYENETLLIKLSTVDVPIELHWSLFNSPFYQNTLPIDWFWGATLPVQVGETPTRVLGPEAQILHLCGHLRLHHGGEAAPRVLWLHDVAEVISFYGDTLDWDLLLEQAATCALVLPVQQVLKRVAELWRVAIPEVALDRLQKLRPSAAEARAFARLSSGPRPVAQRLWDDVEATPGWRQKLHFAVINLFPSPAYMVNRYKIAHPLLLPLYYPYRWYLGVRSIFR